MYLLSCAKTTLDSLEAGIARRLNVEPAGNARL